MRGNFLLNSQTIYTSGNRPVIHSPLNKDFCLYKNANVVNLTQDPQYLNFGIMGLCIEGYLIIDIYENNYIVKEGNLIIIMPGQVLNIKEKSPDLKISYFRISQALINDVLSGISRLSPLFFIHMRRKYLYNLTNEEFLRYFSYINLVDSKLKENSDRYHREYVIDILKLFYLDLYNNYENQILYTNQNVADSRKEKLTYDFFLLIMEHHKEEREVVFYANKLSITPKYLSAVVKEISGRTAKDWITEYTLLEIKSLLNNFSLNIQEVAVKTNFSNQASLGRFFKKHTRMSPSEYRLTSK